MTAHDPSLHRKPGGLLGWLGFGKGDRADGSAPTAEARPELRGSLRLQQLEDVARFLAAHQLEVNAASLAAGWSYLAGANRDLVRAIDRRIRAREPLTQAWLEEQLGTRDSDQDLATLADLMRRLEASIDEFGKTSHDAHRATSDYHTALEGHVGELEQVTRAGEVISDLANIAKVMLKRTREIEKQMLRSEAQTRALRRRLDEARRSAEEDHLTGLPNRRAFEARFAEEYRDARAAADQLCVAFCDIDHFKRINDEHGHDAGDRVLKLVADCLARLSDDKCHVARHGGEEFVVLLRGTSVEEASVRLEALRAGLAERRLVNRANDRPFGQVTFSAGIADVFTCSDPRSALRAADAALYRAKQDGRNRIALANAEDCETKQATAA
ncbi:diguanylate cyclase [Novosphingobium sp.]|uniref:GGDEF domain-containing protein n=1 Tax=Novosphingobium sp. TaxID=1874826 RepID=UPI00286D58DF|nr:diguanylate cyclase [Novosphingobium sp.]